MLTGSIGMLPSASAERQKARPVRAQPRQRAGHRRQGRGQPAGHHPGCAMMLRFSLNQPEAADRIEDRREKVLAQACARPTSTATAPKVGTVQMATPWSTRCVDASLTIRAVPAIASPTMFCRVCRATLPLKNKPAALAGHCASKPPPKPRPLRADPAPVSSCALPGQTSRGQKNSHRSV